MERRIYTLPGLEGRFIFDFIEASDHVFNELPDTFWQVEVVSLPGIPVLANSSENLTDLMLSKKLGGNVTFFGAQVFLKNELPIVENRVIEYCKAYSLHIKTGLPISLFLNKQKEN